MNKESFEQPGNLRSGGGLTLAISLFAICALATVSSFAAGTGQKKPARRPQKTILTSHPSDSLSPETRETIELAGDVICKERLSDPKGSVPIDDMQGRPSLPVRSPEALAGAQRAQRFLPVAKAMVIVTLKKLSADYALRGTTSDEIRLRRAIARVEAVKNIRPDVDSRDNASVFLKNPRTIVFGTIFLAGLPSDEGIISVLAHELVHIADGSEDNLRFLFAAIGDRASKLTAMSVHDQRAEELSCDLVGALASRAYVGSQPSYESLPRRISRSLEHNCVSQDEGDDDHLSPRSTIRALLALNPALARELVYGR